METYSEYNYQGSDTFLIGFAMISLLFALAVSVLMIICLWKIFRKAGYGGWESIIPIYNMYILLKIVGKPGWWLLLMFIPLINLIFVVWTYNMLSKSFGKDEGFTVGLLMLGFIFLPILAFGKSRYIGPYGDRDAFQAYQNRRQFDFDSDQSLKR